MSIFQHSFLFLPSHLLCSSPSFHRNASPKWLTPSSFNMHSWCHPGRAKLLCMLTKMIHKYYTINVFKGIDHYPGTHLPVQPDMHYWVRPKELRCLLVHGFWWGDCNCFEVNFSPAETNLHPSLLKVNMNRMELASRLWYTWWSSEMNTKILI